MLIFETAPEALYEALRIALGSLGGGPVLIEAIACLAIGDQ